MADQFPHLLYSSCSLFDANFLYLYDQQVSLFVDRLKYEEVQFRRYVEELIAYDRQVKMKKFVDRLIYEEVQFRRYVEELKYCEEARLKRFQHESERFCRDTMVAYNDMVEDYQRSVAFDQLTAYDEVMTKKLKKIVTRPIRNMPEEKEEVKNIVREEKKEELKRKKFEEFKKIVLKEEKEKIKLMKLGKIVEEKKEEDDDVFEIYNTLKGQGMKRRCAKQRHRLTRRQKH